jgi:hypothetical protein
MIVAVAMVCDIWLSNGTAATASSHAVNVYHRSVTLLRLRSSGLHSIFLAEQKGLNRNNQSNQSNRTIVSGTCTHLLLQSSIVYTGNKRVDFYCTNTRQKQY